MTKQLEVGCAFGILCDPIKQQLEEQGFELLEKDLERVEKAREHCNHLRMSTFLTESEANKVNTRMIKFIAKNVTLAKYKEAKVRK